jgi:NAD(P)H-hydrate repair Nnr-like enzyme with NAD(P)H-hydrate dehydratase domain
LVADALNALPPRGTRALPGPALRTIMLTPHPGEIGACSARERESAHRRAADGSQISRAIAVLKGRHHDRRRTWTQSTGPGFGHRGLGDVLSESSARCSRKQPPGSRHHQPCSRM